MILTRPFSDLGSVLTEDVIGSDTKDQKKCMEKVPILIRKGFSLKLKGKVHIMHEELFDM